MILYGTACIAVHCYAGIGPVLKKARLELPTFLVIGISSTWVALGAFAMIFSTQARAGLVMPNSPEFIGFLGVAYLNLVGWALYLYSIKLIAVVPSDMIAAFWILVTACFPALLLKEPSPLRYHPDALFLPIGPDLRKK
jgi:drug/metabolite transporter (DMT)-like permease